MVNTAGNDEEGQKIKDAVKKDKDENKYKELSIIAAVLKFITDLWNSIINELDKGANKIKKGVNNLTKNKEGEKNEDSSLGRHMVRTDCFHHRCCKNLCRKEIRRLILGSEHLLFHFRRNNRW